MNSYRTAIENYIDLQESDTRASWRTKLNDEIKKMSENDWKFFSYQLNAQQREFFDNHGVPLHPNGCLPHPHPASKTIENFLLFNLMKFYLKDCLANGENVSIMSMKYQKFKKLGKLVNKQIDGDFQLLNKVLDCTDSLRYGSNWPIVRDVQSYNSFLSTRSGIKNRVIFIHDEIHHWSLHDLSSFLRVAKPKKVFATAVFPIEVAFGSKISLNPHLYEFEISGDKMYYFPDGKTADKYQQSIHFPILKERYIQADVPYSITFLKTVGSHHLIFLERNGQNLEEKRFFSDFSCFNPTLNKNIFLRSKKVRFNCHRMHKMILYLLSLKKPDIESAIAKLRQISGEGIDMFELPMVVELGRELMNKRINFCESVFDFFFDAVERVAQESEIVRALLPSIKRRIFCRSMDNGFKHFLEIDLNKKENFFDGEAFYDDLPENLDDIWFYNSTGYLLGRTSSPYSLLMDEIVDSEFSARRKIFLQIKSDRESCNVLSDFFFEICKKFEFSTEKMLLRGYKPKFKLLTESDSNLKFKSVCKVKPLTFEYGPLYSDGGFFLLPKSFAIILRRAELSTPKVQKEEDFFETHEIPDSKEEVESVETTDSEKLFRQQLEELEKIEKENAFVPDEFKEIERLVDDISKGSFRGNNLCLIEEIAFFIGSNVDNMIAILCSSDPPYWLRFIKDDVGGDLSSIYKLSEALSINIDFSENGKQILVSCADHEAPTVRLVSEFGHIKFKGKVELSAEAIHFGESNLLGSFGEFLETLPSRSPAKINLSWNHAEILRNAFMEKEEGILLREVRPEILKEKISKKFHLVKNFDLICGLPGSGKTFALEAFLRNCKEIGKVLVVTPRKNLKAQWEKIKKLKVVTFETFFLSNFTDYKVIIFDECFLFPNGYFDLVSAFTPWNELQRIILVGDPCQSKFYSLKNEELNQVPGLSQKIDCDELNYMFFSRRLDEEFNNFFPFPCMASKESEPWKLRNLVFKSVEALFGQFKEESDEPDAFLVSSFEDRDLFNIDLKKKNKVMTFGESQGLSFDRVCIVITPSLFKSGTGHLFVALSRARHGICFLNYVDKNLSYTLKKKPDNLVSRFILNEAITDQFLEGMLRLEGFHKINFLKSHNFGNSFAEEKLEGDPWLRPYIFLGQVPEIQKGTRFEPIAPEPTLKTHIPLCPENLDFCEMFEKMKASEAREFVERFDMSSQFIDSKPDRETKACQPMLFEAIYPRHKASDEVTFWAAVKKRLRFSRPEVEREKFIRNFPKGKIMFENFIKFVPIDPIFENFKLEIAERDFENAKLKKDKATITNNSNRSCLDWSEENIFLFMKSQLCTKMEKRFCDAKAGQTLACFNHLVLVKFSKWCRYIDRKVHDAIEKARGKGLDLYIHTRKNFDELNLWVKRNDFSSECTESDYEAFDVSQDSIVLAFEVCLMEFLKFPIEIIESYKWIKFNLRCKLGNFAIMRFTGEFCTFLFNTLSNMAFTFMRYEIERRTSICFAGDDMCANKRLKVFNKFEPILGEMSLKAKVSFTKRPTFCGWILSSHGIVKQPSLIWERFRVAQERDKMKECLESYMIEACYAYELGDRLFDILDEESLHYYYLINRLIIKRLSSISSSIKHKFSLAITNINGGDSCEQVHQGIQEFWESDGSDSDGLDLP